MRRRKRKRRRKDDQNIRISHARGVTGEFPTDVDHGCHQPDIAEPEIPASAEAAAGVGAGAGAAAVYDNTVVCTHSNAPPSVRPIDRPTDRPSDDRRKQTSPRPATMSQSGDHLAAAKRREETTLLRTDHRTFNRVR